jgi:hypothetical protein
MQQPTVIVICTNDLGPCLKAYTWDMSRNFIKAFLDLKIVGIRNTGENPCLTCSADFPSQAQQISRLLLKGLDGLAAIAADL